MVDVQRWSSLGVVEVPINLVLVIDDEAEAATFVKQSLEEEHISVRVARDGGQAHASFTMHKPDFVILDLMLPGESGFEICERIKKLDEGVPILVLSAIDMEDSRELAARVGADGYLLKPVTARELVKTVRDLAEQVWQRTHLEERKIDHERIRFNCGCGKKFKVSASHKGKSMTCPQCGEPLIVPKHSTTV
ncbi:MAG: response regulator [Planctomycetaceae bacterium]|nr:response regulator [Planctomycetaceae bacterium]